MSRSRVDCSLDEFRAAARRCHGSGRLWKDDVARRVGGSRRAGCGLGFANAGDDDPVVLLKDLSAELVSEGLGDATVIDDLGRSVLGAGPSVVTRLGRALAEATRSFLIVLDDVHLVTSVDGVALIECLADHVPTGSQLVVAGRAQHPFVARQVGASIVEVGPEDLSLDAVGALSTFAVEGLIISSDRARQIVDRTEGWPAGVYLSALIAGHGGDDPDEASYIDGSSPFVSWTTCFTRCSCTSLTRSRKSPPTRRCSMRRMARCAMTSWRSTTWAGSSISSSVPICS